MVVVFVPPFLGDEKGSVQKLGVSADLATISGSQ